MNAKVKWTAEYVESEADRLSSEIGNGAIYGDEPDMLRDYASILREREQSAGEVVAVMGNAECSGQTLAAHEASKGQVSDAEHLRTELGRAYRALHAFAFAQRKGKFLAYTAVMYHSPTIGAAARFVRDGALDGSEYFIGKPVEVLHAALRGDEPDAARNAGGSTRVTFEMVKEAEHFCPHELPHLKKLRWKAERISKLLASAAAAPAGDGEDHA